MRNRHLSLIIYQPAVQDVRVGQPLGTVEAPGALNTKLIGSKHRRMPDGTLSSSTGALTGSSNATGMRGMSATGMTPSETRFPVIQLCYLLGLRQAKAARLCHGDASAERHRWAEQVR